MNFAAPRSLRMKMFARSGVSEHPDCSCMLFLRLAWYRGTEFFVLKRTQHIVSTLLVSSYLFVGAAAHLNSFNLLFLFWLGPEKVVQTKPGRPIPAKVYWTQYKHIPAVTKIAPASSAVVQSHEFPRLQQYLLIPLLPGVPIWSNGEVSPFSSRAPPVKPVVT